jgi:hypothetical protein
MAFANNRFVRQTVAFNSGQLTTTLNPSAASVLINGPAIFTYASADDAIATISAANYFAPVVLELAVNDRIDITGSDASGIYIVSAVDKEAETVSIVSYSASAPVGTANITNDAVTTAKIADNAVTSAKVSPLLVQNTQVDIGLAAFIGSSTTPVVLVAATGANQKIVVHRATLWINYGGTVLAGGGAVVVQYGNTAAAGGTAATGTQAAAGLIGATADTSFGFSPVDTTLVDSATLNAGLYLTAATADFTGGTASAYKVDVWYSVMDVA